MNPNTSNRPSTPAAAHAPGAVADNTWPAVCHIAGLAGLVFPFGGLIGTLLVWLFGRDKLAGVDEHGRAALNFKISTAIYSTALFTLFFAPALLFSVGLGPLTGFGLMTMSIMALVLLQLFEVILHVINAVRARDGKSPRYPLSLRILR